MGTAYLVRHFETESNAQGLFGDGPLDDVATARGLVQVRALEAVHKKSWRIDGVAAGDSERSAHTAKNLLDETFPIILTCDLNEQHPGEWRGMSKNAIDPIVLADWRSGKYKIPGSESDEDFERRVLRFWNEDALPLLAQGKNLLVATSGNPIRVILGSIWRVPWRHLLPALVMDNCGITTIRVNEKSQCFIGPVNDISHLRDVGVTSIPGT